LKLFFSIFEKAGWT